MSVSPANARFCCRSCASARHQDSSERVVTSFVAALCCRLHGACLCAYIDDELYACSIQAAALCCCNTCSNSLAPNPSPPCSVRPIVERFSLCLFDCGPGFFLVAPWLTELGLQRSAQESKRDMTADILSFVLSDFSLCQ